jgi:hypothetical protein
MFSFVFANFFVVKKVQRPIFDKSNENMITPKKKKGKAQFLANKM